MWDGAGTPGTGGAFAQTASTRTTYWATGSRFNFLRIE